MATDHTLTNSINRLRAAGYTHDLRATDDGMLRCEQCGAVEDPATMGVDETVRFEGPSDPADEAILFAVTMPCGHRGVLPATYGKDTEPDVVEVVKRLRLTRG